MHAPTDVTVSDGVDDRLFVCVVDLGRVGMLAKVLLCDLASFDDGVLAAKREGVDDGVANLLRLVCLPGISRELSGGICISSVDGQHDQAHRCSPPMIQKSTNRARASRLTATMSALCS